MNKMKMLLLAGTAAVLTSLSPANAESLAEFTIDRPSGGGLLPGDVVNASIFRNAAANGDSCTGDVFITAVRALYT